MSCSASTSELLVDAPGDPLYTRAIIGERGAGKTVYLAVLSERIRSHGWTVLDVEALSDSDPLLDVLARLPTRSGATG